MGLSVEHFCSYSHLLELFFFKYQTFCRILSAAWRSVWLWVSQSARDKKFALHVSNVVTRPVSKSRHTNSTALSRNQAFVSRADDNLQGKFVKEVFQVTRATHIPSNPESAATSVDSVKWSCRTHWPLTLVTFILCMCVCELLRVT